MSRESSLVSIVKPTTIAVTISANVITKFTGYETENVFFERNDRNFSRVRVKKRRH